MAALRDFLKPDLEQAPRPDPAKNPDGTRYTRTFLWMRLGVGALGVLLPVLLISLDRLVFTGHPFVRDSMSAYYYSGMREFFVGAIFGSGAFLLAYKVSEVSLDNAASIAAGVCAWLIAMCPTGRPSLAEHPSPPRPPLNPLQNLIGENWVKGIHYGASAGFIICLAVVALLFGYREGRLPPVPQKLPPAFWRTFHYSCAVVMGLGAAWILITSLTHSGPRWSTLFGEWVCTWAWALSWLLKGAEWDTLFGTPVAGRRAD
jgi:multisubunit Na+/H+ antiporter MnhB subunit